MASYEEAMTSIAAGNLEPISKADAENAIDGNPELSPETQEVLKQILNEVTTDGEFNVQQLNGNMTAASVTNLSQLIVTADQADLPNLGNVASAVPIVELSGADGASVTLNNDFVTKVVTAQDTDNASIKVADATSTQALTVNISGDGNNVQTAAGADKITFAGGSATIETGAGDDTVVLQSGGTVKVSSQGDTLNVMLGDFDAASPLNATVSGGDGMDRVTTSLDSTAYSFEFKDGYFIMTQDAMARAAGDLATVKMVNVNAVVYDNGDKQLTDADSTTVLAKDATQSLIGRMYRIGLGRDVLDDMDDPDGALGGLNWWTNTYQLGEGQNLHDMAMAMLNVDEFHRLYDGKSDANFVRNIFNNVGETDAATTYAGKTQADFVKELADGTINRFDVVWQIATTDEVSDALTGNKFVIDSSDFDFNA